MQLLVFLGLVALIALLVGIAQYFHNVEEPAVPTTVQVQGVTITLPPVDAPWEGDSVLTFENWTIYQQPTQWWDHLCYQLPSGEVVSLPVRQSYMVAVRETVEAQHKRAEKAAEKLLMEAVAADQKRKADSLHSFYGKRTGETP